MIESAYISDILQLLLDDEILEEDIKNQLLFLTDAKYEYTGSGVFVSFSKGFGIEAFKSKNLQLVLDGVSIQSIELSSEAKAMIHMKEGLVDYLEIWSTDGNYPERDLSKYTITQEWIGSKSKKVVKK